MLNEPVEIDAPVEPVSPPTPAGEQATTPLFVTLWLDGSGSMRDKIEAAYNAIDELLPHLRAEEKTNAVRILVRTLVFGQDVRWLDSDWTPVADYRLTRVEPAGKTPLGRAHSLFKDTIETGDFGPMYPMVNIYATDGAPTDEPVLEEMLSALQQNELFSSSIRAPVAIGANPRMDILEKLASPEIGEVFTAHNADQLVAYLKYVTVASVRHVSQPSIQLATTPIVPPTLLADAENHDMLWD